MKSPMKTRGRLVVAPDKTMLIVVHGGIPKRLVPVPDRDERTERSLY